MPPHLYHYVSLCAPIESELRVTAKKGHVHALEHGLAAANQLFILSLINIAVASRRISCCMRRQQLFEGLKYGFEFGKVVVLSLASVSRPYLNCPSASARCPSTLPLVQQVQPHMDTVDTIFRPLWIGIY